MYVLILFGSGDGVLGRGSSDDFLFDVFFDVYIALLIVSAADSFDFVGLLFAIT